MNKNVVAVVVQRDETPTFDHVEPFAFASPSRCVAATASHRL